MKGNSSAVSTCCSASTRVVFDTPTAVATAVFDALRFGFRPAPLGLVEDLISSLSVEINSSAAAASAIICLLALKVRRRSRSVKSLRLSFSSSYNSRISSVSATY
jgi:hypothetical protein